MSDDEGVSLGKARAVCWTEKAVRARVEGWSEPIWIPRSVIHDDSELYDEEHADGDLVVQLWWAESNGHA